MTQNTALNILKLGHSAFLTGGAGAGKTYVLNEYIKWCKLHDINVAVTASTGIAATHIGGTTLHSWAGIGIIEKLTEMDIDRITQKKNIYDRYTKTNILIIDEISMLHAHRLDMVDKLAKVIRRNTLPFGGIQLVMCGDFFQLPPITKFSNGMTRDFAFYSESWKKINPVICYLTRNYRQEDDSLNSILHAIRNGEVEDGVYDTLRDALENPPTDFDDLPHTKLYTHNADVDDINHKNYKLLTGRERVFEMQEKGKKGHLEILKMSCLAHAQLKLKPNTRVMFIKNDIGKKYNNGTLGEVIDFATDGSPIVKTLDGEEIVVQPDIWRYEEDGKVFAEIIQLPLRYAWAITVHKSQGMTLDAAEMDLSKSFGFGMGYVALSRVRSLSGLKLLGIQSQALAMHPDIQAYDLQLKAKSEKAVEALDKYSVSEIAKKHGEFILRCGGSIEEVALNKDKEIEEKIPTKIITKNIILENKKLGLQEIAEMRNLTVGTIIGHIEDLAKTNEIDRKIISSIIDSLIPSKEILKDLILCFPKSDTTLSEAMINYKQEVKIEKKNDNKQSIKSNKKFKKDKDEKEEFIISFEALRLARIWNKLT